MVCTSANRLCLPLASTSSAYSLSAASATSIGCGLVGSTGAGGGSSGTGFTVRLLAVDRRRARWRRPVEPQADSDCPSQTRGAHHREMDSQSLCSLFTSATATRRKSSPSPLDVVPTRSTTYRRTALPASANTIASLRHASSSARQRSPTSGWCGATLSACGPVPPWRSPARSNPPPNESVLSLVAQTESATVCVCDAVLVLVGRTRRRVAAHRVQLAGGIPASATSNACEHLRPCASQAATSSRSDGIMACSGWLATA